MPLSARDVTRLRLKAVAENRWRLSVEVSQGFVTDWKGRRQSLDAHQIASHGHLLDLATRQLNEDTDEAQSAQELDQIFADHIRCDDEATMLAARLDLDRVVSIARAYLCHEIAPEVFGRQPQIPAGDVNKAIAKAHDAAIHLANALAAAYPAFLQRCRADHDAIDLYRSLEKPITLAVELTNMAPLPTERRRPPNTARAIVIARAAAFYERWTGDRPALKGIFASFVTSLFAHVRIGGDDQRGIANLGDQIRKVIDLRNSEANLETWEGES